MYSQSLPSSAESYAREQRREMNTAMAAVKRQWRRMGPEFDSSYLSLEPTLLAIVRTAQERLVAGAAEYIPTVLDEQGIAAAPFARVFGHPLIGVAGDGRPVNSLLYGAVTGAKTAVGNGSTSFAALRASGQWLMSTVGTVLSDTARQSESLHSGVRPVTGYVRMLNAPSCSRCVVLAGKFYRKNTGFARHPKCDCRHIPSTESLAGDMTVDPVSYFDSLTKAEQDKTFGAAGGEALRSGANMGQVVNARRGVQVSQVGGRKILTTTEGTTRRGIAYREMGVHRATDVKTAGQRYSRTVRPRLMPETCLQVSTDRADYLRLLASNGYLA
jgi:hypothetical protein